MVTLGNIMSQMLSGRITSESPIVNSVYKNFKKVSQYYKPTGTCVTIKLFIILTRNYVD